MNCPNCGVHLELRLGVPQHAARETADSGHAVPQDTAALQLPAADSQLPADKGLGSKASTNGKPFTYNDLEFLAWWEAYPLKREKNAAFRAYRKIRQHIAADVLLAAAQRYAVEMRGVDRSKIKYPSGWLNDGRWDDEPLALPVENVEFFDPDKHFAELEERGL